MSDPSEERNPKLNLAKLSRIDRSSKRKEMARWTFEIRRVKPTMRYSELQEMLRDRFGITKTSSENVLADAAQMLRDEFDRTCADLPRMIADAYMDIHEAAMNAKKFNAARMALDSVRDMFGMRKAININVTTSDSKPALPNTAYRALTIDQLGALESLGAAADASDGPVIDVQSTEVMLASIADAETSLADLADEADDAVRDMDPM